MTQEALADAVGKDRASIANHLRLLRLPAEVQRQVSGGALSMGQARALVALENPVTLKQAADDVVARGFRSGRPKRWSAVCSRRRPPASSRSRTCTRGKPKT